MYGPWDAPFELQLALLDEGDPPPVEEVSPPDFQTAANDPDAPFRYSCAYASQVMVLDECWDSLLDILEATGGADSWLVSFIGARGYPLGEHRRIGGIDPRLYIEQLHVPWLIRSPHGAGRLSRRSLLKSHVDLAPLLTAFQEIPNIYAGTQSARAQARNELIAMSDGHRSVRTADWCLRQDMTMRNDELVAELYVRPDDRWEANDVAKLCPDVVDELTTRLNDLTAEASAAGENRPIGER
jgi:arylsulfatase A-like enzyme